MFRKMRRSDREIGYERILDILNKGEYGVLSVMTQEGYPYGIPLSYACDENAVYFHSANMGHKLDAIEGTPEVSFTVVGNTEVLPDKFSTKFESVVIFGKASVLEEDEKVPPLKLLIEKYSPDFIEKGNGYIENDKHKTTVIKLEIDHITGKARD